MLAAIDEVLHDARRFPGFRRRADRLGARRCGRTRAGKTAGAGSGRNASIRRAGSVQLRAGAPLVPRAADGPDRRLQHAARSAGSADALDVPALERALREVVLQAQRIANDIRSRGGNALSGRLRRASLRLRAARPQLPSPIPSRQPTGRSTPLVSEPFDRASGPLLRVLLLRLAESDHVLELVFDHIICDGWSHIVVFDELASLYDGFRRRRGPAARRRRPSSPRITLAANARG